jgi:hypothetical protein
MDLEAQLEAAGLPKIAIEVRPSGLQGPARVYALVAGPTQQQINAGSRAPCCALRTLGAALRSVAVVHPELCTIYCRWTGRTTLPATLAPH